jgi:hypothetical protein
VKSTKSVPIRFSTLSSPPYWNTDRPRSLTMALGGVHPVQHYYCVIILPIWLLVLCFLGRALYISAAKSLFTGLPSAKQTDCCHHISDHLTKGPNIRIRCQNLTFPVTSALFPGPQSILIEGPGRLSASPQSFRLCNSTFSHVRNTSVASCFISEFSTSHIS